MTEDLEDYTEKLEKEYVYLYFVNDEIKPEVIISRPDPYSIMYCFLQDVLNSYGGEFLSTECVKQICSLFFLNDCPYEGILDDARIFMNSHNFFGVYENYATGGHVVAYCSRHRDQFVNSGFRSVTEFWLIEEGRRVRKVKVGPPHSSERD